MIYYTIIRSDRQTLALQIKDGEVIVRAPRKTKDNHIKQFVLEHYDWIEEQLCRYKKREAALDAIPKLSEAETAALKKRAKEVFAERTECFARVLGVEYGRISIRCQRTRWGSCTAKGDLSFNAALMLAPPEVLDSVVAHELCHRKYMNHSEAFYAELERVMPEYRKCRKWLRENGDVLLRKIGNV
ncbi:MAG: M48 family metallopeptidase [Ruminococcaceae bacterium]|nr:M48 family metallopeptidase [Oscillospiraceae bacterium]